MALAEASLLNTLCDDVGILILDCRVAPDPDDLNRDLFHLFYGFVFAAHTIY